jgi:hypothetical protein
MAYTTYQGYQGYQKQTEYSKEINVLQVMSIVLIYNILVSCIYSLYNYYFEAETNKYIDKKPLNKLKTRTILDDVEISDEDKIDILEKILDINSLDRTYILYYIFKKQGNYYIDNNEYNSYEEYKYWKENYLEYENGKKFNLDETLIPDMLIILNNTEYEVATAHINFISWLYYSGLYNYLLDDISLKTRVLHEINDRKLLKGKLFLSYILFTNQISNKLTSNNKNIKVTTTEISKEEIKQFITTSNNDINTTKDNTCDTSDNEYDSNEECDSNTSDNELSIKEEKKFRNNLSIDDIDKYEFLGELIENTTAIALRGYTYIREILLA